MSAGEKIDIVFDPAVGKFDHHAATASFWTGCATSAMRAGSSPSAIASSTAAPDMAAPVRDRRRAARDACKLIPLAPLHQPHNLAGIEAAIKAFPERRRSPASTPPSTAAIPSSRTLRPSAVLYDEGVRRYGFHGLSYEYIARRLKSVAPQIAREDVIVAHLGNGASMCAIRTAARWPRPWASPRSTACRWARAAASSIPACCCT